MIYLLCLIVALNIVLLIEVIGLHGREQEREGAVVNYSETFIILLAEVVIIGIVIYVIYWLVGAIF